MRWAASPQTPSMFALLLGLCPVERVLLHRGDHVDEMEDVHGVMLRDPGLSEVAPIFTAALFQRDESLRVLALIFGVLSGGVDIEQIGVLCGEVPDLVLVVQISEISLPPRSQQNDWFFSVLHRTQIALQFLLEVVRRSVSFIEHNDVKHRAIESFPRLSVQRLIGLTVGKNVKQRDSVEQLHSNLVVSAETDIGILKVLRIEPVQRGVVQRTVHPLIEYLDPVPVHPFTPRLAVIKGLMVSLRMTVSDGRLLLEDRVRADTAKQAK